MKESGPLGFAIVASVHACLVAYLKFKEALEVAEGLAGPFRKAVCKVTDKEFESTKSIADHVVRDICIVLFCRAPYF